MDFDPWSVAHLGLVRPGRWEFLTSSFRSFLLDAQGLSNVRLGGADRRVDAREERRHDSQGKRLEQDCRVGMKLHGPAECASIDDEDQNRTEEKPRRHGHEAGAESEKAGLNPDEGPELCGADTHGTEYGELTGSFEQQCHQCTQNTDESDADSQNAQYARHRKGPIEYSERCFANLATGGEANVVRGGCELVNFLHERLRTHAWSSEDRGTAH